SDVRDLLRRRNGVGTGNVCDCPRRYEQIAIIVEQRPDGFKIEDVTVIVLPSQNDIGIGGNGDVTGFEIVIVVVGVYVNGRCPRYQSRVCPVTDLGQRE